MCVFYACHAYSVCACGGRTRYMDGSVFEVGIQMGGNFVYFTGIVMGVYLKLVYAWVVKTGF